MAVPMKMGMLTAVFPFGEGTNAAIAAQAIRRLYPEGYRKKQKVLTARAVARLFSSF